MRSHRASGMPQSRGSCTPLVRLVASLLTLAVSSHLRYGQFSWSSIAQYDTP
jgi:hypothetical protein